MEQKEIYCDACGGLIYGEGQKQRVRIRDRVLVKDKADTVTERFFTCQHCGKHYTVTVIDRQMRLLMQRRIQIQRKTGEALKSGNKKRAEHLMLEAKEMARQLKRRADELKEMYVNEIEGTEEHPQG